MATGAERWQFHEPHLTRAVEQWRQQDSPPDESVGAFYEWAVAMTEGGPPSELTFSALASDEYVSLIAEVEVLVTYLAVEQDRRIFVRKIESL